MIIYLWKPFFLGVLYIHPSDNPQVLFKLKIIFFILSFYVKQQNVTKRRDGRNERTFIFIIVVIRLTHCIFVGPLLTTCRLKINLLFTDGKMEEEKKNIQRRKKNIPEYLW